MLASKGMQVGNIRRRIPIQAPLIPGAVLNTRRSATAQARGRRTAIYTEYGVHSRSPHPRPRPYICSSPAWGNAQCSRERVVRHTETRSTY